MQATLSNISDGIKSTGEENETLRAECIRLKEQLMDTLNRLQKSAEYNEKIVEVRAAESKL
jgi:regulator of replication initiation timing